MLFERKYYLSQLQNADGNGMIKIITGMRRCGKSFLLFNIFRKSLLERGIHEDQLLKSIWRIAEIRSYVIQMHFLNISIN
mgnify:CR=1 FL=1